MPERYTQKFLSHLADRRYAPSSVDELIDDLNVPAEHADAFRAAIEELLESGQVVRGNNETIALPPPGKEMIGTFRRHERGFGFLVPDELTEHGDLFIPPGSVGDAVTGDKVKARVIHEKGRGNQAGKSPYVGRIIEVVQRAEKHYAGTLIQKGNKFGVEVNGRVFSQPVLIRDPHAKNAKVGDKVVIDLTEYPDDQGGSAEGVIVEVLGEAGEPDVETLAVMRSYGLVEKFPEEVAEQARNAAQRLDDEALPSDREDLTGLFICTIDPPDAKDYDDAISIRKLEGSRGQGAKGPSEEHEDGDSDHSAPRPLGPLAPPGAAWELGVHIADVAHYIEPDSPLDKEAYERGNSTYLPRKVIPMLPEVLSNGVCSLQEGVKRYAKSCFLTYDDRGNVLSQRFAKTVIKSAKRMTYLEAQALIDDDIREARKHAKTEPKYPRELIQTCKLMNELATTIRERRMKDGMIVLGLPAIELVYDESGRVVDAEPEDDAFTHKIIEMFMVEANEAAARVFAEVDVPMIRRIHPDPDAHGTDALQAFARVAGFNIPKKPSRIELQQLLEAVRGKPAQHAVHMAVLKTLSKAEYSPLEVGHFALASEHYTHFTSPIRRYPDLIVHRALNAMIDHLAAGAGEKMKAKKLGQLLRDDPAVPDEERLRLIGRHCSTTERNSESAERELRAYLVLELLSHHLGEDFAGTVTGVTGQGVFIQIDRYLIDGFIRTPDLPGASGEGKGKSSGGKGDRYQLNRNTGALVAQRSGRVINIGDTFTVRIANVDLARRQMELVIVGDPKGEKGKAKNEKGEGDGGGTKKRGKKKAKAAAAESPEAPASGSGKTAKSGKSRRRRGKGGKGGKGKPDSPTTPTEAPTGAKRAARTTIKLKKHRGKKRR